MDIRMFTESDYPEIASWWKIHEHPVIPINMLSPYGLVGYNDKNEPAAACFVYLVQGCDIAQLSWAVTNPNVSARDRYNALDACIKGLIALSVKNERTNIVSFSGYRSLNKLFGKNGLKELKDHKMFYSKVGVL